MAFDTKKIFDRVKGAANDVAGAVSDLGEKTGNKIFDEDEGHKQGR